MNSAERINHEQPFSPGKVVTKHMAHTQETHMQRGTLGSDKIDPYSDHLHTSTKRLILNMLKNPSLVLILKDCPGDQIL